ncbi:hypothetical protein E2F46_12975 [Luteimonas aestuarii]|uniref:Type IV secretion system protein VirB5 n=1 Tax=Luteimonas aestuarii TaxID=453837 RepID=A0A4R5TK32_9GAMM|nr:hypothetical protein [Luteimonas aestuarii]TDK22674.1 hypothetical protein E2F46_12975 [Luteimonas aestuarii]
MKGYQLPIWKGACRAASLVSVLLCGVVATGAANAQAVVTDPGHTLTNKLAWIQQYQQMYHDYQSQLDQLRNQIRQIEQQYVQGEAFKGTSGYRETLTERGLDDHAEERCGRQGDLPSGPERIAWAAQRQFITCRTLVQTENARYNAMVRIMETLRERDQQLADIRKRAGEVGPDQPGTLARLNNNIAQIEAQMSADVENAQRLLQAYDSRIQVLRDEQAWVGQAAFSDRKKKSLIDTAIQHGTLKAALEIARTRDR